MYFKVSVKPTVFNKIPMFLLSVFSELISVMFMVLGDTQNDLYYIERTHTVT